MDIMLNVADSYDDVDHSAPVVIHVDCIYYDVDDGTLVILQGDDAYGHIVSREKYDREVRSIFQLASVQYGFVDLTRTLGTFVMEPDGGQPDEDDPDWGTWARDYKEYKDALKRVAH